jgi:hypothetical protein
MTVGESHDLDDEIGYSENSPVYPYDDVGVSEPG